MMATILKKVASQNAIASLLLKTPLPAYTRDAALHARVHTHGPNIDIAVA